MSIGTKVFRVIPYYFIIVQIFSTRFANSVYKPQDTYFGQWSSLMIENPPQRNSGTKTRKRQLNQKGQQTTDLFPGLNYPVYQI